MAPPGRAGHCGGAGSAGSGWRPRSIRTRKRLLLTTRCSRRTRWCGVHPILRSRGLDVGGRPAESDQGRPPAIALGHMLQVAAVPSGTEQVVLLSQQFIASGASVSFDEPHADSPEPCLLGARGGSFHAPGLAERAGGFGSVLENPPASIPSAHSGNLPGVPEAVGQSRLVPRFVRAGGETFFTLGRYLSNPLRKDGGEQNGGEKG